VLRSVRRLFIKSLYKYFLEADKEILEEVQSQVNRAPGK
jgi:hypothetical protein